MMNMVNMMRINYADDPYETNMINYHEYEVNYPDDAYDDDFADDDGAGDPNDTNYNENCNYLNLTDTDYANYHDNSDDMMMMIMLKIFQTMLLIPIMLINMMVGMMRMTMKMHITP